MSQRRLDQIEAMIDDIESKDLNDSRLPALYNEADRLAEEITHIQELTAEEARKREEELKKRNEEIIRDILQLKEEGKCNEIVAKYGGQFVDDYEIQGNTVISYAKDTDTASWTVDDPHKKLQKLLYYRVYDHYIR